MLKLVILLGLLAVLCTSHSFKEEGAVMHLTADNFTTVTGIGSEQIKKNTFVMFYTNYCPYSKKLKPIYDEFAEKTPDINVVAVNCEVNKALCKQLSIKAFPTLIYFTTDNKKIEYSSISRTLESLQNFVFSEYKQQTALDIIFKPVSEPSSAPSSNILIDQVGGFQDLNKQKLFQLNKISIKQTLLFVGILAVVVLFFLYRNFDVKKEQYTV
ncbi:hypothetical protein ABPG74_001090 [Tetrahymena malaccensis]